MGEEAVMEDIRARVKELQSISRVQDSHNIKHAERLARVETKVDGVHEDLDELKREVRDHKDAVAAAITDMKNENSREHAEVVSALNSITERVTEWKKDSDETKQKVTKWSGVFLGVSGTIGVAWTIIEFLAG